MLNQKKEVQEVMVVATPEEEPSVASSGVAPKTRRRATMMSYPCDRESARLLKANTSPC